VVTPHRFAEGVFRTSEMPFLFGRLARANVRTADQEMIDRIEGDRAEIPGIWIAARAPFRALILLSLQ
jgi:hypothetical protein